MDENYCFLLRYRSTRTKGKDSNRPQTVAVTRFNFQRGGRGKASLLLIVNVIQIGGALFI